MNRGMLLLASLLLALLLSAGGLGAQPPAAAQADTRYFAETQHWVRGLFARYWNEHGGLAQQGYPLTEEFDELSPLDGKTYTVQYFERAVFERHPENAGTPYEVLLAQLGTYELQARYSGSPPPGTPSAENPRPFPETGHTLGGKFRAYWEQHGELAQQGYPITDEFPEVNKLNGNTYTVQYFERAIFEYHPENAGTPFEVLLTQLGKYQLDSRYPNNSNPAAAPVPGPPPGQPTAPPATPPPATQPPTPPRPARPTPTRVGTNCEAVAETRKASVAHTGPVAISYVEATGDEFVEISNEGTTAADLSGWRLRDKNEIEQSYAFPAGTSLAAGATLTVYTMPGPGRIHTFDSRSAIWNNCGDALELVNAAGQVVATYAYGTHCMGNCP